MLKRKQLIGANFSFQHHPFRWTAEKLSAMGFDRMEFWGVAPPLDLFHDNRARLAEVKSILDDNGLTVPCFTPEQVLYPINIASGDGAYREASVERFMRAADISAELGATYLFLTPGRGFECESRETAWEHSVASINRIAAHARSLGVSCLLEPLQRLESKVQTGVNITSTISGMGPITAYQQRWMARAALARFAMDATGEKALNAKRMRVLGIDEKMQEKIRMQLQKHAGYVEGESGTKLRDLNIEKWDPAARHALEYAIFSWTRKMVQENDLGQLNMLLGSTVGKLMAQFRMFAFAAWTKNTLHNLHMRDFEAASMVLATSFFGSVIYAAQSILQSQGRSDQDKFLEKRLDTKSLAAAAIQRGAWSSLLPMGVDIGTYALGADPIFDTRSTGTPMQGILSNPSVGLIDNVLKAARGGTASLFTDEAYSQKDARALQAALPWGNALPVVWIANSLMQDLPDQDTHRVKNR